MPKLISLVVPCLNEQDSITPFCEAIELVFHGLEDCDYEIVFVNDGSKDDTLRLLVKRQEADPRLVVVDLTRNFGKEAALTAGIEIACGDAVIPIDIDMQDPPRLIPEMIRKWEEGYDVVLARRVDRSSDSFSKRASAGLFYAIYNRLSDQPIPGNVGDFRLMDRKVAVALGRLPETTRFMKGLFAWLGFRTATVDYIRPPRAAGKSKFRLWKLWNFALDGMTSFSTLPLRIWTYVGLITAFLAFMYGNVILWRTLICGVDIPGYASLIVTVAFIGGLQLTGLGILGEYLGRTYMECKRRPIYLINQVYGRKLAKAELPGSCAVTGRANHE